jgi:hypothetical protein
LRAGLHLSVPALLAELNAIGETVLLYQGERGRPRARHMITKMSPTQQLLYTLFDLDRYPPDADLGNTPNRDQKLLGQRKQRRSLKIFRNSG